MHLHFMPILILVVATSTSFLVAARSVPDFASDEENLSVYRRDGDGAQGEEGMQDALKYLEEMDKYYSQVARPR